MGTEQTSGWHVLDRDGDVDTLTPAVMSLWWGFNVPGCVILARVLQHGRVYLERDLKFRHQTVADVAREVKKLVADRCLPKRPAVFASPDLFAGTEPEDGVLVEPIADVFAREGVPLVPSHGDTLHGWQRMNDYLRAAPDGQPWLTVSPRCKTVIQTMFSIEQKKSNPEEPDGAVYAAHAVRLLLNSRPSVSALTHAKQKPAWGTVGWLKGKDSKPRGTLALS